MLSFLINIISSQLTQSSPEHSFASDRGPTLGLTRQSSQSAIDGGKNLEG